MGQLVGLRELMESTLQEEAKHVVKATAKLIMSRLHHRGPSIPNNDIFEAITMAESKAVVAFDIAKVFNLMERRN
jgi:hypothetical protein